MIMFMFDDLFNHSIINPLLCFVGINYSMFYKITIKKLYMWN